MRSFQNGLWLCALPAIVGMGLFLRILTLHREREIQLHENTRIALELRKEFEGRDLESY